MYPLHLDAQSQAQSYLSKLAILKTELGERDEAIAIFNEILTVDRECDAAKDAVIKCAELEREMG